MKLLLISLFSILFLHSFGTDTGPFGGSLSNLSEVSLTGFNNEANRYRIVWQDSTKKSYKYFIVYRGYSDGIIKDSIANLPYDPLTNQYMFTDYLCDPNKAPVYSIIGVSSSNQRIAFGTELRPIYLKVKITQQNSVDLLSWNKPSGTLTGKYYIYRGTTKDNLAVIDSIIEIDSKDTLTHEFPHNIGTYIYQVSAVIAPNTLKSDTGPFSQSFSNMSEASLVSNEQIGVNSFKLYPNPASSSISIPTTAAARVFVYNSTGQLVLSKDIAGKEDVNIEALTAGLYKVCVETAAGVAVYSVVKK